MDLLINIGLLALAFVSGIVAIGGETWLKGEPGRTGRITPRGWGAVLLLALTLVLGVIKEMRTNTQADKLRDDQEKYQRRLLETQEQLRASAHKLDFATDKLDYIANVTDDIEEKERLAALALDSLFSLNRPALLKVTAKVGSETREKSGFFINQYGYAITADFAVTDPGAAEPSSDIEVETFHAKTYRARVVAVYPQLALAVLKSEVENNAYLRLASRPPRIGEQVLVIGSTGRELFTRARGRITEVGEVSGQYSRDRDSVPGFGGGPIVDIHGMVIGLNWGALVPPMPGKARYFRADRIGDHLRKAQGDSILIAEFSGSLANPGHAGDGYRRP